MQGLAIGYYIWSQPVRYVDGKFIKDKGIDKIHTRDGREMFIEEWEREATHLITQADSIDLLTQIEEYVQRNCLWVNKADLRRYSMDCLLGDAYKHWRDFVYQEKLTI